MSHMVMAASKSSMFTFESTVHSSHVLRCLDEQRRQDTLCDVTVVVEEGQSFRAHRSVLASCSEYFTQRISALTQQGVVVTLPQEVTAAGFEPLLKFAYTSKLHFRKDNVLEIRKSASVLGFKDLDEACFEFLLPKFFSSNKAPFTRKTCCKKKCKRRLAEGDSGINFEDVLLDKKEVKPVADSSSQQEVAGLCNKSVTSKMESQNSTGVLTSAPKGIKNDSMQCPKYRKFQIACGKESCGVKQSLHNTVNVIRDNCGLSCMPCTSSVNSRNKTDNDSRNSTSDSTRPSKQGADNDPMKPEIHDNITEKCLMQAQDLRGTIHVVLEDERRGNWDAKEKETDHLRTVDIIEHTAGFRSLDRSNVKGVSVGPNIVSGAGSSGLILRNCSLGASAKGNAIQKSGGQEEDKKMRDSGTREPVSIHQEADEQQETEEKGTKNVWERRENGEHTASMERVPLFVNNANEKSTMNVAENLTKPLGSDVGSSQANFHDPDVGSYPETGSEKVQCTSLEWLKHISISSSGSSCPFLSQDLDQSKCLWKPSQLSECEGASQSGVSSLNSGEDGDSETETEGDSEFCARERARQMQLPFTVDWIVDLSRNDFQQLLKQQALTPEQLEFVHDMRRRSKNRLAAQRCRKRKLDCIYNLQCEILKLKTEREKLLMEKSQLSQLKLKTCHTVSALCQTVCNEANLLPEQLQVLAKYNSPDCPLASFCPHVDALISQPGFSVQCESSLSACPGRPDKHTAFEETSSTSSRDTGDGQYSPAQSTAHTAGYV